MSKFIKVTTVLIQTEQIFVQMSINEFHYMKRINYQYGISGIGIHKAEIRPAHIGNEMLYTCPLLMGMLAKYGSVVSCPQIGSTSMGSSEMKS